MSCKMEWKKECVWVHLQMCKHKFVLTTPRYRSYRFSSNSLVAQNNIFFLDDLNSFTESLVYTCFEAFLLYRCQFPVLFK